jgi:hypothetical protein
MRSTKLIPALAVTSALLVLAPAGASARPAGQRHASPNGRCHISLIAEPHTITSGESVQLFGQLVCTGGGVEGQTVTISERTPGTSFKVIGTPTTGAGGSYTLVVGGVTTDALFHAVALNARSANRAVRVAPVVTLVGPPEGTSLFTGFKHRVTFTGTVNPADAGAELLLEREQAATTEEWHGIQRGFVGPGGVYALIHTFVIPGDANLRVIVRPHGTFTVRGISNTLSYGISQAQNPNLTIHTNAYTVPYGSPITLSGVLASGAGKTVTLLSHTAGKPFEPVTTAVAGPGGEYKFVQMPLQDTGYQVTGGGLKSAALFQGVKYLLTAGVSGKSVQAGQSLTFAGTVTPVHPGKIVYLERENQFGGGFHVADVGAVTAGGTYSITHFFFGVGKQVYRIKVPGDPDNQAMSSTPFTIEVTPAPPAALKPVVPAKEPH